MLPDDYECAYYGKWHLGDELKAQRGFSDWRSIEDGIYRDTYSDPEDLERRSDYHHFLIRDGFPPDYGDDSGMALFSRPFAAAMGEPYTKASFLAGEAEAFLGKRSKGGRPFFLSVNFLEPHPPVFGPLNGLHDPADVPIGPAFGRPRWTDETCPGRPGEYPNEGFQEPPAGDGGGLEKIEGQLLGLVTLVDRALGRILRRAGGFGTGGEHDRCLHFRSWRDARGPWR